MNKFTDSFSRFSLHSAKICNLILALVLLVTGFFTSAYAYMDTQKMIFAWDNLLLSAASLLMAFFLLYLLTMLSQKNKSVKSFLLIVVMLFYALGGIVLIVFNKSTPGADPMTVFRIAEQFAQGHLGAIHPTDSYLSYYPHQIGLAGYYEILLRIWNLVPGDVVGYHFIKIINLFWTELLIICLYKVIGLLFDEDSIQICYLFLLLLHLPLLMFTTFVYGELPSIAIFSLGLLSLLKLVKKSYRRKYSHVCYTLLSLLCFSACVAIRKNTLVLMIAVCIALFFVALTEKRYGLLLLCAGYVLTSLGILPAVQAFYELRAGNYLAEGVPALTFIAMGMQYAERGNGWYNGYNFLTYEENGLNAALASEIASGYITERLSYFLQHPGEFFKFYFDKFQVQWCDVTYASLQATLADLGGRRPIFVELYTYTGSIHVAFIFLCNVFQNLLYLGHFVFSLIALRDKKKKLGFLAMLCPIAVLGIFLFHMLWEANSRYIFHSALLLLPTAAYGLGYLLSYIRKIRRPVTK